MGHFRYMSHACNVAVLQYIEEIRRKKKVNDRRGGIRLFIKREWLD